MTSNHNGHRRGPARANTTRLINIDYLRRSIELLKELGDVPILNFASFWDIKYGEGVDFVQLGHPNGLVGYLREHSSRFELYRDEMGILRVNLVSRPTSSDDCAERVKENLDSQSIAKQRAIATTIERLFDKHNYLWAGRPWAECLMQKNISVASSTYEVALDVHKVPTTKIVRKFQAIFQNHQSGIEITQLYKLVDVQEVLTTFNVSISIVTLVDELPEIFYRTKVDGHDMVFDGFKNTIKDLTGKDNALFADSKTPDVIVTDAINSGMYQRTLLLIKETGQIKGLKVNVWCKSIEESFYAKNRREFEKDMAKFNPLTFFLALARYDLVELKSSEGSRNDIRAHLPRNYIDLIDLKSSLPYLSNLDSNSEGPEENGNLQKQSASKNQDAAAAVMAVLKSKN